MVDWEPGASAQHLRLRAVLYHLVREFFARRDVLEVETPLLCTHSVSDRHIESIAAPAYGYLQSSPEYAMKRQLCAGSGDIYQLAKAFRASEEGRLHNPEFTLLEWYRTGVSLPALMAEVAEFIQLAFAQPEPPAAPQFLRYRDVFQQFTDLDPMTATTDALQQLARERIADTPTVEARSDLLDLLFTHCVQEKLQPLTFVFDYPACQAALARIDHDAQGQEVALRFECFYRGVELANGYDELRDAAECEQRFANDNHLRQQSGLQAMAVDTRFIAALQAGLPPCCGVALGIDRLLLLLSRAHSLDEVLAFSASRA